MSYKNNKHTKETRERLSKLAKERWRKWKEEEPEYYDQIRANIKKNHKKPGLGKKGPLASGWKGGRFTTKRDGYIHVYQPEHPNARKSGNGSGGYVLEHRLVMEKAVGRYLNADEDVNHINGDKKDNRIENLRLVRHHAHYEEHRCPKCNFEFWTR